MMQRLPVQVYESFSKSIVVDIFKQSRKNSFFVSDNVLKSELFTTGDLDLIYERAQFSS